MGDFDPGPCPHCGQRNYEIEWVNADPYSGEKFPGEVRCLNPDCPGRVEWAMCEVATGKVLDRWTEPAPRW